MTCPRCGAPLLAGIDGDPYCMMCGYRRVDVPAFIRDEQRVGVEQGARRRRPSHGKTRL